MKRRRKSKECSIDIRTLFIFIRKGKIETIVFFNLKSRLSFFGKVYISFE
jgi:hypothetical protein